MEFSEISQQVFDAEIRAETIVHLDSQILCVDPWGKSATDSLDEFLEEICRAVGAPELIAIENDPWALVDYLRLKEITGFLIQFSTPIPHNFDGKNYDYSWALCKSIWIYYPTLVGVFNKAIKWQAEVITYYQSKAEQGQ